MSSQYWGKRIQSIWLHVCAQLAKMMMMMIFFAGSYLHNRRAPNHCLFCGGMGLLNTTNRDMSLYRYQIFSICWNCTHILYRTHTYFCLNILYLFFSFWPSGCKQISEGSTFQTWKEDCSWQQYRWPGCSWWQAATWGKCFWQQSRWCLAKGSATTFGGTIKCMHYMLLF